MPKVVEAERNLFVRAIFILDDGLQLLNRNTHVYQTFDRSMLSAPYEPIIDHLLHFVTEETKETSLLAKHKHLQKIWATQLQTLWKMHSLVQVPTLLAAVAYRSMEAIAPVILPLSTQRTYAIRPSPQLVATAVTQVTDQQLHILIKQFKFLKNSTNSCSHLPIYLPLFSVVSLRTRLFKRLQMAQLLW